MSFLEAKNAPTIKGSGWDLSNVGTSKNCPGKTWVSFKQKMLPTKLMVLFLIGSSLIREKEGWDLSNVGQAKIT